MNHSGSAVKAGVLYLVGTPLGNNGDFTPRALEILAAVDLVACEDTRVSALLFAASGIGNRLISYHEHNKARRGPELVEKLLSGQNIALVSDAGMPAISDPGQDLVRLAAAHGITVSAVPGPTAAMTVLAASGLDSRYFVFEGFLPAKGSERRKRLEMVQAETRTQIIYEAPHRLLKTLEDFLELGLERRRVVAGREITKRYEEYLRMTVGGMHEYFSAAEARGEFTLVLEGKDEFNARLEASGEAAEENHSDREAAQEEVRQGLARGDRTKDLVKHLVQAYKMTKNEAYELVLAVRDRMPGL